MNEPHKDTRFVREPADRIETLLEEQQQLLSAD
jgi:hypothetical protein